MKTLTDSFRDYSEAWLALARAQLTYGRMLAEAWQTSWPSATRAPSFGSGCSCAASEPCFMPHFLGERRSHVGRCEKAQLKLRIENCDRVKRQIRVVSRPQDAFVVSDGELELGPKQRRVVTISFDAHEKHALGDELEGLIWIDGCRQQYLRWVVTIGGLGVDDTSLVEVADCPDYRHRWQDHFTCARPCQGAKRREAIEVVTRESGLRRE